MYYLLSCKAIAHLTDVGQCQLTIYKVGNEKFGWFTLLWYSAYCPGLENSLDYLWDFAVSTRLLVYIFHLELTLGWLCSKMDKRSTVEIQWNIHLKTGFSFTSTNNVWELLWLHFLYHLIQIYFKGCQLYEYMRISQQFFVRLIIRDMFNCFIGLCFCEDIHDLLELTPKEMSFTS